MDHKNIRGINLTKTISNCFHGENTSNQFPPIDIVFAQSNPFFSPLNSISNERTSLGNPFTLDPSRIEETIKSILSSASTPRKIQPLILEEGMDPFPRRYRFGSTPAWFWKMQEPGFVFAHDQIRKRRRLANWISRSRMAERTSKEEGIGSPLCLQHKLILLLSFLHSFSNCKKFFNSSHWRENCETFITRKDWIF